MSAKDFYPVALDLPFLIKEKAQIMLDSMNSCTLNLNWNEQSEISK